MRSDSASHSWRIVGTIALLGSIVGVLGGSPASAAPGDRNLVAGTGVAGYSGDFGLARSAQIRRPAAIEVLSNGSYLVADEDDNRVRVVSANSTGDVIRTLAGNGVAGFSGDNGDSVAAQLSRPRGLAVDKAGAIYIADSGNNRIRKINGAGVISTFAGTGEAGFAGDGGPALNAKFNSIGGIATDPMGNLYIADSGNRRVRKISASSGFIATLAGTGVKGTSDTELPATFARLAQPVDIDTDSVGNVFIVDQVARRVVKIDASGWLSNVAGNGTDGTVAWKMATETGLAYPNTVDVDASGESVLVGTLEGVYAISGMGRIARASEWGTDTPDISNRNAVLAVAARTNGDLLLGVGASIQEAQRPVGHISGVVRTGVDGAWLAVPGALIELLDEDGEQVATASADSFGRYDLVAGVGQWNLRFSKPGFAPFEFLGSPGAFGAGVRVPVGGSITMANPFLEYASASGTALVGAIKTETGIRAAAEVALHQADGTALSPVASDDQGRFLFANLSPGNYALKIVNPSPWADGWWTPEMGFTKSHSSFTVGISDISAAIVAPRARFTLNGEVTDNFGNALSGGTIEMINPVTGEVFAESAIAADGTYRMAFVAPTPATLALHFHPSWNDHDHQAEFLGGGSSITSAALVNIGKVDQTINVALSTPAYIDAEWPDP